jgi:hypothetical protein
MQHSIMMTLMHQVEHDDYSLFVHPLDTRRYHPAEEFEPSAERRERNIRPYTLTNAELNRFWRFIRPYTTPLTRQALNNRLNVNLIPVKEDAEEEEEVGEVGEDADKSDFFFAKKEDIKKEEEAEAGRAGLGGASAFADAEDVVKTEEGDCPVTKKEGEDVCHAMGTLSIKEEEGGLCSAMDALSVKEEEGGGGGAGPVTEKGPKQPHSMILRKRQKKIRIQLNPRNLLFRAFQHFNRVKNRLPIPRYTSGGCRLCQDRESGTSLEPNEDQLDMFAAERRRTQRAWMRAHGGRRRQGQRRQGPRRHGHGQGGQVRRRQGQARGGGGQGQARGGGGQGQVRGGEGNVYAAPHPVYLCVSPAVGANRSGIGDGGRRGGGRGAWHGSAHELR